jgi:hypothetical protein
MKYGFSIKMRFNDRSFELMPYGLFFYYGWSFGWLWFKFNVEWWKNLE